MLLIEGSSWALSKGKPLIERRLPSNLIGLSDRRTRSVASESGRRRDWSRSRVPDRWLPVRLTGDKLPSVRGQQMMRGLCQYLIGRLVTFIWESQTGRAQSLLF